MRMQRRATDRGILRQSFGRSFSSEEVQHTESHSAIFGVREGHGGTAGWPVTHRTSPKRWCVAGLSVVGSAVAVAAVGCFCALLYPILRELRAERVRGQDGTEQRMLGFWSILVLSVVVGCICCVFSWTLTYLDFHHAGTVFPTFKMANLRDTSGFHLGYGIAVLNGIMGLLAVIWSLS